MTSASTSTAARSRGWSLETRLCVIVFGAALALNVGLSAIGWGNTLLGGYQFRQIQTAITTQYFLQDGLRLNYITPILGPPWEIPLELPLVQAAVAGLVKASGIELDVAGRLVSWLFFLSALPACFLLLGRFGVPPARRLVFLALLLLSPIYLFFSRAFLIESAALSFSCWFLFCFRRVIDRPRIGWLVGAAIFGALAGTIKVTTFIVFLVAAFLLVLSIRRKAIPTEKRRVWFRAAIGAVLPVLASIAWVFRTAAIRHLNPETSLLEGHFGYWSFGDLELRLSPGFWLRTYRVWADLVVGEAGIFALALYYAWTRGRYRWVIAGSILAFLSGQMIFANLYWVHAYYFYASGIFLVAAIGFLACEWLDCEAVPVAARWALIVALLGLELSAYQRSVYGAQKDNIPVPEYIEALKACTDEDDVIVVIGQDWDGMVPYYAHRRALMLVNGKENDFAAVQQSISRVDRRHIAAVVIQGFKWRDAHYVAGALAGLNLGTHPLFTYSGVNLGIWVPEERQALIRDRFDARAFPAVQIAAEENTSGKPKTIHSRQIAQRREFENFRPRPIRGTSPTDFGASFIEGKPVLNAHSNTEIVFRSWSGTKKLTGIFGIVADAYAHSGMSDGVEFCICERKPDGTEVILFRRFLDPEHIAGDRGPQHVELLLPEITGELILRTTGGPSGSVAYDWAYWGDVHLE